MLMLEKTAKWDRENLMAARIILADPTAWGGPESGPALWARRVVTRQAAPDPYFAHLATDEYLTETRGER